VVDFSRLSAHWFEWSNIAGLEKVSVSTDCDDCQILFISSDYSVHLRSDGNRWLVDTVNDRGQRHDNLAEFSTFELAEKYLIWTWASSARGVVGAPRLGPRLYSLGFSSDVDVNPVSEGVAEITSSRGSARLMEPYATIFSHLMSKSVDEIEKMVREGVAR
jgi:hypothetical protein